VPAAGNFLMTIANSTHGNSPKTSRLFYASHKLNNISTAGNPVNCHPRDRVDNTWTLRDRDNDARIRKPTDTCILRLL
jgi:hypothetical protein